MSSSAGSISATDLTQYCSPKLIKKENRQNHKNSRNQNNKPWNPKEKNKSLPKIRKKSNSNKPIEPDFAKFLNMIYNSRVERIKLLDQPNPNKHQTRKKKKNMPIHLHWSVVSASKPTATNPSINAVYRSKRKFHLPAKSDTQLSKDENSSS